MLEDQVAYLLQRYLGNYVRGLNKEALKISVWQGSVSFLGCFFFLDSIWFGFERDKIDYGFVMSRSLSRRELYSFYVVFLIQVIVLGYGFFAVLILN